MSPHEGIAGILHKEPIKVNITERFMLEPGDLVPNFRFLTGNGSSVTLYELTKGPTLLIFLRHLA